MRAGWVAIPAVAIAGLLACDGLSFHLDCTEEPGICDAPEGGLPEGGPNVPAGCDLTRSPKDSTPCIDDSVGIFVSPTGSDGATGTKAAPLKSLAKGLEAAAARGLPRVYVCEGSYGEAVEMTAAVSVYGGLSCAWAYTGAKPKLAPAKGIALRITNVSGAVVIEDLDVTGSADANVKGDSAIAAFVSQSANVTFRTTDFTATDATAGAAGDTTKNYSTAAKDGVGAVAGASEVTCLCLDGQTSSTGGKGGAVGAGGDSGRATPPAGADNGGLGGTGCLPGTVGADGAATTSGRGGHRAGAPTASAWATEVDATAGAAGNPGQGGGGGGGRTGVTIGGGGACGGCGGGGGKPGAPGGSSIALVSFKSTLIIEGGTLKSGSAGTGGNGGPGQDGQKGGAGGAGACDGGPGGNGAGGSGGGGGAGGHSLAIGFVGSEPQVVGATLTPGRGGTGGSGGAGGGGPGNHGAPGTKGADGSSQPTLAL